MKISLDRCEKHQDYSRWFCKNCSAKRYTWNKSHPHPSYDSIVTTLIKHSALN